MKELVDSIVQKAGISGDQATTAVNTVVAFLKNKLPQPLAGQIDGALGGGTSQGQQGGLGGIASAAGDMLGKRKAG